MESADAASLTQSSNLLQSIAEQLKLPLTAIAREAELGELAGIDELSLAAIRTQATVALSLVDSYLLGLQLMTRQRGLDLEPVSVSSTLVDAAHELSHFANQYNVDLELHLAGKYGPVWAHRGALKAALLSMGYTLIEAQGAESAARRTLTLAAYRSPNGIIAGLYGDYEKLNAEQWKKALMLCGRARQPFTSLTVGSGAGLFIAEAIMQAMDSCVRVGRHQRQTGLAATLNLSPQLQLV